METISNTPQIAFFRGVPGLTVTERMVWLPVRSPEVVKKNEAFEYVVLNLGGRLPEPDYAGEVAVCHSNFNYMFSPRRLRI